MTDQIQCVIASNDTLGEGCLWDAAAQSLWWLDIARPTRIQCFTPATGEHKVWTSDVMLTTIAKRKAGGFVVGGGNGLSTFNPDTGEIKAFASLDCDFPNSRTNDGSVDAQGRMWIGSMMENIGPRGEDLDITADTGKLFRVDTDTTSHIMESSIGVSNGPCWSPDGKTFYFTDSKSQHIYAYDFNGDAGTISNRRIFNDSKAYGYPDGATVDAEGFLWSARWEGSCVLRIDPKGRIDRVVDVPASRVTCPVFGGADMDILYLTTSRAHVSSETLARFPHQGGVFAFKPGVKGLLKNDYAG
jgi:sugar lactone lactonase YvrE